MSRTKFVVLWSNRNGLVYAGACREFRSYLAADQRQEVMDLIWEGTMKRKALEKMKGVALHGDPSGLQDTHPCLAEFMTSAVFSSGDEVEPREAPTLTLWCTAGQWRGCVKDRAEGLVLWLSAESWSSLLQMIDLFVTDEDAPWRRDEGSDKGKRLKK